MMAELDFGESEEQAMIVIRGTLKQHHRDLYGNGRTGIIEEIREFMAADSATRKERERAQKWRHSLLGIVAAYLLIAVTALLVIHK